jgi:hypothetical protein
MQHRKGQEPRGWRKPPDGQVQDRKLKRLLQQKVLDLESASSRLEDSQRAAQRASNDLGCDAKRTTRDGK